MMTEVKRSEILKQLYRAAPRTTKHRRHLRRAYERALEKEAQEPTRTQHDCDRRSL